MTKKATARIGGHKLKVNAVPRKVRDGVAAVNRALQEAATKRTQLKHVR